MNLAADRGRTIVKAKEKKKEETSREQVLCCHVPLLSPLLLASPRHCSLHWSWAPMMGCATSLEDIPARLAPKNKTATGVQDKQLGQQGC